jgi:hypothetical protein
VVEGHWLRRVGQALARSPGWQLVVGGAILALAFPTSVSGAIGLMVIAGALGVGVAVAWPQSPSWLRTPPERLTTAFIMLVVAVTGVAVPWDALTSTPDWQMATGAAARGARAHHAVAARPACAGMNHAVSTGDAPLELYPALTYLVTGQPRASRRSRRSAARVDGHRGDRPCRDRATTMLIAAARAEADRARDRTADARRQRRGRARRHRRVVPLGAAALGARLRSRRSPRSA